MSSSIQKLSRSGLVLGAGLVLTACFTTQQHTTLDAIGEAVKGKSSAPFVEAFIEYGGPHQKWAGPASWILHIGAREPGLADISVAPGYQVIVKAGDDAEAEEAHPKNQATRSRSLASASEKALSSDAARVELAKLGAILQESDQKFEGCLWPVRIRMIRQDGTIFEKQGCRSQAGWPAAVSKLVADFVPLGV